jgi:hypothetical protein
VPQSHITEIAVYTNEVLNVALLDADNNILRNVKRTA